MYSSHLRPRRAHARPGLEPLEARQLLTTYLVTNVEDSGPGSLRQAILDTGADLSLDGSKIDFAIPGDGVHTIAPATSLPPIQKLVAIDGTTQHGYAGTPLIAIDGAKAGSSDGLTLSFGSGGSISGLAIERFSGTGIQDDATTETIRSNYIGVDPTGRPGGGNQSSGIVLSNSNGSIIGGPGDADGNVIGGNADDGIRLDSATNTLVSHNFIGTDRAGRGGLGNQNDGVFVASGATAVTVVSNTISNNGRLAINDQGTNTKIDLNTGSNNGLQIANLTIQASSTALNTATGRVEMLTYTVVNRGPGEAPGANLSVSSQNFLNSFDFIPPPPIVKVVGAQTSRGTTFTSPDSNSFTAVSVLFGTLAPGDSAEVTLAFRVVRSGHDALLARLSYGIQPFQSASTSTSINAVGTVDLAVAALPVPAVVKVGTPLAFTFLITNRDAEFATFPTIALDLTGLHGAAIVSVFASQGTIAPLPGRTDFYAGALTSSYGFSPSGSLLTGLNAGASATVTVVVIPTRPGPVSAALAASYVGDVDPVPSNNLALAGVSARLLPTVTRAALQPDLGAIRSVVLDFDAPLTRSKAQDVRNYRLATGSGRSRVGIRSAVYDAKADRVTLLLSRALPRTGTPIRLEVGGPGTPGLTALDGSKLLNGSYSSKLGRG